MASTGTFHGTNFACETASGSSAISELETSGQPSTDGSQAITVSVVTLLTSNNPAPATAPASALAPAACGEADGSGGVWTVRLRLLVGGGAGSAGCSPQSINRL